MRYQAYRLGLLGGLLMLLAGCSAINSSLSDSASNWPSKPVLQTQRDDLKVQLFVPPNDPASIGTMRVDIKAADGAQEVKLERDGEPKGLWLLGASGQPPVIMIWTQSAGSGSYGELQRLDPAPHGYLLTPVNALAGDELQGYMGHDFFEVKHGQLYRSFPYYNSGDTNAEPSGGDVCYRYDLTQNKWHKCSGKEQP